MRSYLKVDSCRFVPQSICRVVTWKVNVEINARAGVPALSARVSTGPYPALRYGSVVRLCGTAPGQRREALRCAGAQSEQERLDGLEDRVEEASSVEDEELTRCLLSVDTATLLNGSEPL